MCKIISEAMEPQLVKGKKLASNSLLNLATGLLIVGLHVIFVPLLLNAFGRELYGVLTVTWMVLANLAWLDFGLSRASARYVAQELALGRSDEAALWTWTAVSTQVFLGVLVSGFLWLLAPLIVDHIHVQQASRDLVILTIRVFAFSIPIDFANRSVTGVLQAAQRFDWVNGLSLFGTLSMFAVYGGAIVNQADFQFVVYGLFILRVVNLGATCWAAIQVLPSLRRLPQIGVFFGRYRHLVGVMLRYGSWIAVASIAGPLLLNFDQWAVTVILGVALLPFYAVPFGLLWRLFLFPSSLASALFPAFSALEATKEWSRIEDYFVRAHRYLLAALIPALFVLYEWAFEILRFWIGQEFASEGTLVMRILILGFGVGLLGPISGALLEAIGRADVLVKLYIVELPFNIAAVWLLSSSYGIVGAAASYVLRSIVETVAVWIVISRIIPFSWKLFVRTSLLRPFAILVIIGVDAYLLPDADAKNYISIVGTLMTLLVYSLCMPFLILDRMDRQLILSIYTNYKSMGAWKTLRFFVPSGK